MTDAAKPNISCAVPDCDRSRYGRLLWCEKHYYRVRRYGDPLGGKYEQAGRRGDFWSKVDKDDPSGCWVWKGSVNKDANKGPYGQVYVNGARPVVHRLVYEQMVGPIPEGYEVDHLCRNTLCVKPEHLEAVTRQENLDRRVLGNAR